MTNKIFRRVRFYDTDEMGVAHHANYIRWFENGRVEFLRALGITLGDMIDDGILFPIIEISAKYFHSAKFDDELEIETEGVALTRAKMEFAYKVRRVSDGEILAEGFSRNVFTSATTGKITRLPEKFFAKFPAAYSQ